MSEWVDTQINPSCRSLQIPGLENRPGFWPHLGQVCSDVIPGKCFPTVGLLSCFLCCNGGDLQSFLPLTLWYCSPFSPFHTYRYKINKLWKGKLIMELLMGQAYAECFCISTSVWTLNQTAVTASWRISLCLQLSVCNNLIAPCASPLGRRTVGRGGLLFRNFPGWLRG